MFGVVRQPQRAEKCSISGEVSARSSLGGNGTYPDAGDGRIAATKRGWAELFFLRSISVGSGRGREREPFYCRYIELRDRRSGAR